MKKIIGSLVLVASIAVLQGCGTTGTKDASVDDHSASSSAAQGAGDFSGHPLDNPANLLSKRVVYFDFDSSAVKAGDREVIAAHAEYLASNPGAAVTLEGHADERGSREYNIGLGERRGKAVGQLMKLQGAGNSQLQTVSYGEERPVATGHDEDSWGLNRRVEIVYTSR